MFSHHMVVAAQSQHILASCRNQGDAKTYEVRCFSTPITHSEKNTWRTLSIVGIERTCWQISIINSIWFLSNCPLKCAFNFQKVYISLFMPFYSLLHILSSFIYESFIRFLLGGMDSHSPPTSAEWGRESTSLVSILLTNLGRWDIRGERPERPVADLLSIELRDWYVRFHCFFSSISLISFPLAVCTRRYMRTLGNSFSNGVLAAPCCRNPKKLEVRTT